MASNQMLLQDCNNKTIQGVGNYLKEEKITLVANTATKLLSEGFATIAVIIKAYTGNTGNIYIGGPGVDTSSFYLDADQSITLEIDNSKFPIYVFADNADSLVYIAIQGKIDT